MLTVKPNILHRPTRVAQGKGNLACTATSVAKAREIALDALVAYARRGADCDGEDFTSRCAGSKSAGLQHWHPFVVSANLHSLLDELADRFMDEAEFEEEDEEEAFPAGFEHDSDDGDDGHMQGFKVFFDAEAGGMSARGSVG